ncbi:MAG: GFA family protein [Granulosicoccus sp.]
MSLSGNCLCGAVSYTCEAEPVFAGNCHCNHCKKSSGSGYAPTLFFPESSVSVSGEVKYFDSKGESGKTVSRGFCPQCGSQLFGKPGAMPGVLGIRAGTLEDTSAYKPQMEIFTSRAAVWACMDQDLPKFPEMPPPPQE